MRKLADHPGRLLLMLALLVLLAIWLLRRTTWPPAAPLRIARRRAVGQGIRAAGWMYRSRWQLFIGIGFLTVPAPLLVPALQSVIVGAPEVPGVPKGGEGGGFRVLLAAFLGFLILGASILLVLAATTHALGEIDRGDRVDVRRAYRLALARWRPLLRAFLGASALVGSSR